MEIRLGDVIESLKRALRIIVDLGENAAEAEQYRLAEADAEQSLDFLSAIELDATTKTWLTDELRKIFYGIPGNAPVWSESYQQLKKLLKSEKLRVITYQDAVLSQLRTEFVLLQSYGRHETAQGNDGRQNAIRSLLNVLRAVDLQPHEVRMLVQKLRDIDVQLSDVEWAGAYREFKQLISDCDN